MNMILRRNSPEIRDYGHPRLYPHLLFAYKIIGNIININVSIIVSVDIEDYMRNVAFRKFQFRSYKINCYIELTKFSDT